MKSPQLTRRSLLAGLGAGTALGSLFLDSPVARGQASAAPVRLLLIPLQHGWGRDRNFQNFAGTESTFTIPAPLTGLEAIKHQCVFVDGLRGTLWGNAHDVSYSDIFTASVPWDEGSSAQLGAQFPEPLGPSIDWHIANTLKKNVFRGSAGYQSWGKPYHPLCFDSAAQQQAFYTNARQAFDAVVAPLAPPANPTDLAVRNAVRNNVFSYVAKDMDRLITRLSGTEKLKLEGHLAAVNDLNRRITGGGGLGGGTLEIPPRPGDMQAFEKEVDDFFDMVRVLFTADTHRVAVLGLGEQVKDWTWTDAANKAQVGNIWNLEGFHHDVAHHGDKADQRRSFEGWAAWYVRKIVSFVQRLEQTPDVDGRMLIDNTIIVLTGEVETGEHDTRCKLHTVIGGGGGIRRGRWLKLPDVEPRSRGGVFIGGKDRAGTTIESGINYGLPFGRHHHADLWVTIARLCGAPVDTFGTDIYNFSPISLT
ncbi:MAG: DUF1552 domain-containing protein [Polyangiaceae bacterium]|nr:DUF1552 domain-containing protein [Polyangiaceae bacterium]